MDIKAVPNIYIDVVIDGQKQVYEVSMARDLYHELGIALDSLEATVSSDQDPDSEQHTESQTSP